MSEQPTATKIIIRHIGGSKKGETDSFPLSLQPQIRIGRGPDNDISFDPLKEDTISRSHCIISFDDTKPDEFFITDHSRNGTFVNDKAITEKTKLFAGDVIRLGKEGPVLEFDLDPRPASHSKMTRVISSMPASPPTQQYEATGAKTTPKETPAKETVGKQTMQHMLQQSEKKNKSGLLITVIAVLLVVATGGYILFTNMKKPVVNNITQINTKDTTNVSPAQIAKTNDDKVVFIERGWKLTLTQTGDQLYHVYLPIKSGGITKYMAAYVKNNMGRTEPYLVTKNGSPTGDVSLEPIGGFGSGSGFVVDEKGFIITNRHVAAPWLTSYHFSENAFPGLLLEPNNSGGLDINKNVTVSQNELSSWVPAEAMNYNRQQLESGIKLIDGADSYMDVTFSGNSLRTPAKIVRISNTHDVAMIKIDLPEALSKVAMYDNYKDIEPGSVVTVMGYPGVSPDQFVASKSQDNFNRNPNIVKVPVPTLSTGNVGRLIRGRESGQKVDDYLSMMGDYYQLTINSTGPGNSGGPMFDDKGRVTGIYSAGNSTLSFSIPIKYAMELMGRETVIKN